MKKKKILKLLASLIETGVREDYQLGDEPAEAYDNGYDAGWNEALRYVIKELS